MIKLYGVGRVSGRSIGLTRDLRVLWALEEFGQEYVVIPTDLGSALSPEASAALGPFRLLPAIEDGGFVLRESGAILLYLTDKAGALDDDPRPRAELAQWCFAVLTTVEPWLTALWRQVPAEGEERTKSEEQGRCLRIAEKRLRHLEAALQAQTYLLGEAFTVADILLATVLKLAARMELLAALPALEAYRRRCEARPCRLKTLDDYEDRLGLARGAAR
jgi:glutathione S-transferase